MKAKHPAERFWQKVDTSGDCWLWRGWRFPRGWGRFGLEAKKSDKGYHYMTYISAHRFAYEQVNGPVPEGMEIDHLCRVRCCVRPVPHL